jgi:hypothetical protein
MSSTFDCVEMSRRGEKVGVKEVMVSEESCVIEVMMIRDKR